MQMSMTLDLPSFHWDGKLSALVDDSTLDIEFFISLFSDNYELHLASKYSLLAASEKVLDFCEA